MLKWYKCIDQNTKYSTKIYPIIYTFFTDPPDLIKGGSYI